jgi:hypothetical protein
LACRTRWNVPNRRRWFTQAHGECTCWRHATGVSSFVEVLLPVRSPSASANIYQLYSPTVGYGPFWQPRCGRQSMVTVNSAGRHFFNICIFNPVMLMLRANIWVCEFRQFIPAITTRMFAPGQRGFLPHTVACRQDQRSSAARKLTFFIRLVKTFACASGTLGLASRLRRANLLGTTTSSRAATLHQRALIFILLAAATALTEQVVKL